jgi:lysophospholipase L1-like esterase
VRSIQRLVVPFVGAVLCAVAVLPVTLPAQADQWAKDMAAFEQQDAQARPAAGGIVFVGSSSIRLWDLPRSFPGLPVINRGFGGSQISDSIRHVALLVIKHQPRTVVLYAGDNDISSGKTPQVVAGDFKTFAARVHADLPKARILFVGIKPSIQRWALIAKVREANGLIREICEGDERLGFVDVDGPMLGWDEKPRKDLFVADGLHLSAKGYELWNALVRPFLD